MRKRSAEKAKEQEELDEGMAQMEKVCFTSYFVLLLLLL